MLNETLHEDCLRLREDFEPRRPQDLDAAHRAHLASCESCCAWTTHLGEALVLVATQEVPLPKNLGERLSQIGRGGSRDTAYETESPEVRASLDAFLGAQQQPLPPSLKLRLRKIARPQPLPIWLRDPRWVSAACVLLTVLSMPLLGHFGDDAARLATVSSYRSGEVFSNVEGTVMVESREKLQKLREEQENLQQKALDLWSASWPQSWSPSWPQAWSWGSENENTGEDHGKE